MLSGFREVDGTGRPAGDLKRSRRASASSVKIKSSVSSVLSLVSMECSRAARSWRGFARRCCWCRAYCISGSVNWTEMPCLRRNHCDHPLPLLAAGTRDSRSVFLDGHLQSEDDCGFILVEHGDNAPAVDDGDPAVEHVRHIAGLAVDRPDACRGDLFGKSLLLLLGRKPLLREVGPVGCCCRHRAVDRYAARLIPALHRAAVDCAGRHNAIREVVRPPARLLRRPCPQPMSGDSSEMLPAASVEWTASGRVLRERIEPQPGRAGPSCPAMAERMRESPSFVRARRQECIACPPCRLL